MDFTLTPEQESLRERVRAWLRENMPAEWTRKGIASSEGPRPQAYELLRDRQRELDGAVVWRGQRPGRMRRGMAAGRGDVPPPGLSDLLGRGGGMTYGEVFIALTW